MAAAAFVRLFRLPAKLLIVCFSKLNACSHEVQKAFYSLIHERRIGEDELPVGSVVIGAGSGTVLQSAIDLLEQADDFPRNGPILIITDGLCDHFKTRREHAILLPEGRGLRFTPQGKIFRMSA